MAMGCISEKGLAARWGVSRRTLQRWRQEGIGPKYLKLGGRVVYELTEIEAFEDQQRKDGTAAGQQTPSRRSDTSRHG